MTPNPSQQQSSAESAARLDAHAQMIEDNTAKLKNWTEVLSTPNGKMAFVALATTIIAIVGPLVSQWIKQPTTPTDSGQSALEKKVDAMSQQIAGNGVADRVNARVKEIRDAESAYLASQQALDAKLGAKAVMTGVVQPPAAAEQQPGWLIGPAITGKAGGVVMMDAGNVPNRSPQDTIALVKKSGPIVLTDTISLTPVSDAKVRVAIPGTLTTGTYRLLYLRYGSVVPIAECPLVVTP